MAQSPPASRMYGRVVDTGLKDPSRGAVAAGRPTKAKAPAGNPPGAFVCERGDRGVARVSPRLSIIGRAGLAGPADLSPPSATG